MTGLDQLLRKVLALVEPSHHFAEVGTAQFLERIVLRQLILASQTHCVWRYRVVEIGVEDEDGGGQSIARVCRQAAVGVLRVEALGKCRQYSVLLLRLAHKVQLAEQQPGKVGGSRCVWRVAGRHT